MRKIVIDAQKLDQEFEEMLDEMYMKFHYHQSSIPHFESSEKENSKHNANAPQTPGSRSKKVTFHRDENWCNGLPRKR